MCIREVSSVLLSGFLPDCLVFSSSRPNPFFKKEEKSQFGGGAFKEVTECE